MSSNTPRQSGRRYSLTFFDVSFHRGSERVQPAPWRGAEVITLAHRTGSDPPFGKFHPARNMFTEKLPNSQPLPSDTIKSGTTRTGGGSKRRLLSRATSPSCSAERMAGIRRVGVKKSSYGSGRNCRGRMHGRPDGRLGGQGLFCQPFGVM